MQHLRVEVVAQLIPVVEGFSSIGCTVGLGVKLEDAGLRI